MTNVISNLLLCSLTFSGKMSYNQIIPEKGGTVMENTIVKIENLVKRYKELIALDHLSLDIKQGEIFGLLGPNG